MAEEYGIDNTVEVLESMGDSSVLMYAGVKAASALPDTASTAEKAQAFAQAVAAKVMLNGKYIENYKKAMNDIGIVPKELKDLSFGEIVTMAQAAGNVMIRCANEVKQS
jgi:hypothetical protein